jgi:hypothetical protein
VSITPDKFLGPSKFRLSKLLKKLYLLTTNADINLYIGHGGPPARVRYGEEPLRQHFTAPRVLGGIFVAGFGVDSCGLQLSAVEGQLP